MAESVKYRGITITIHPWTRHDGRSYWRFTRSSGGRSAFKTIKEAKDAALREAQMIYGGTLDVSALNKEQIRAIRAIIDADPTCRLVDQFLAWHAKKAPVKLASEAVAEFLAAKEGNRGLSSHNVENLRKRLKDIPEKNIADITPDDLPETTGAPRTRRNKIAAWTTFFRWCVKRGYLPTGELTAPERLDRPQLVRGVPTTWSPDELEILLANVSPQYLPWLALSAYAGFRTEEICPDHKSGKSPLAWEDFAWDRDIIIVRAATAKTGRRRIVPILPALRAILEPLRGKGAIGPHLPPHTPAKGGKQAETTRLGAFVGGWRRNALRHSWISYRAAVVGMAQTAMEAGNSESEARKSYDDAKSADEAAEWFKGPAGAEPTPSI